MNFFLIFFFYLVLKDNIYRLSNNGIRDTDDTLKEDNSIKQGTKEDFSSFEDLINPDFDKTLDLGRYSYHNVNEKYLILFSMKIMNVKYCIPTFQFVVLNFIIHSIYFFK